MVFLDFIICRNGAEEKVQELLLPLLPSGHAQIPSARSQGIGFVQGSGVPLLPLQLSGHHSQPWKAEEWEGAGGKVFFKLLQGDWILSAVRVLQDPLLEWQFSRIYYSYPAQFLVICHHTFITIGMKTFSVSFLYSCFASWCCATPEFVIFGQLQQWGRIQACTTVPCLKPLTRTKTLYLISWAERS